MDLNKIGSFISKKRKEKDLTQEELASALGINSKTISRWETGKNMPDVSLYKPICEILEISLTELINGEEANKENMQFETEKALIGTVNLSEANEKKNNKIVKLLVFLITITLIVLIFIIGYYGEKYPIINIYSMDIIEDIENDGLVKNFSVKDYNVWLYGIKSFQLMDENNNFYDIATSLKHNQTDKQKITEYLELQYENGNMNRFLLSDGGTAIYKNNKFEIIVCKTIEGNEDLYFGTPNITDKTKGGFCGKSINNNCYFTRTFHILDISETDDMDFVNITIVDNKEVTTTTIVNNSNDIKAGKDYEFIFSTDKDFSDNTKNIFENSTLIEVKETNKSKENQINNPICVNK